MSTPAQPARTAWAREFDGVGQRAGAGARHHLRGRQARFEQRVQQAALFRNAQRIGLGIGAEDRQTHLLLQQPAAMAHEALRAGHAVSAERREHRRQHARQHGRQAAHRAPPSTRTHWPCRATAASSNSKPRPGPVCSTTRPVAVLQLAVDQAAEVEHLVVPEEFDIARVGRGRHQRRMHVVEPVRAHDDAAAGRRGRDAAPLGDAAADQRVGLQDAAAPLSSSSWWYQRP